MKLHDDDGDDDYVDDDRYRFHFHCLLVHDDGEWALVVVVEKIACVVVTRDYDDYDDDDDGVVESKSTHPLRHFHYHRHHHRNRCHRFPSR